MPFVNFVTIVGKPGSKDEMLKIFSGVAIEVKANEPKTRKYEVAMDPDNENNLFLWEEYEDDEALALHRKSKAFAEWANNREKLTSSISIKRLKVPDLTK